jgi:hypothetical protein
MDVAFSLLLLSVFPILMVLLLGKWDDAVVVCGGIAAAIPASIIEIAADRNLLSMGLELSLAAKSFFFFAAVEEFLKYQVIALRYQRPFEPRRLVKASVLCAIGFGSTENFFYVTGFLHSLNQNDLIALSMLRIFMPFLLHLTTAPVLILGLWMKPFRPIAGITLAILIHGSYDFLVFSGEPNNMRIAYIILLFAGVTSAIIYRKSALELG